MVEFDERLRGCMVDYVTVDMDGGMMVVLRDGTEMEDNSIQKAKKLSFLLKLR